jgi:hypothetical protein
VTLVNIVIDTANEVPWIGYNGQFKSDLDAIIMNPATLAFKPEIEAAGQALKGIWTLTKSQITKFEVFRKCGDNFVEVKENTARYIISKVERTFSSKNAKGNISNQIGSDFEDLLKRKYGGKGSFKSGGVEFDGEIEVSKVWYEAKGGDFWNNVALKDIPRWKSKFGKYQSIANQNGKMYQVYSQKDIPEEFKEFFQKKGIEYFEKVK